MKIRRMLWIIALIAGLGLLYAAVSPMVKREPRDPWIDSLVQNGFIESYSVVDGRIRIIPTLKLLTTGSAKRGIAQDIANTNQMPVVLIGVGGIEMVFEPQQGSGDAKE